MPSELRKLIREIKARGFIVDQGRTHLAVRTAGGKFIYPLPLSPGRGRWLENLRKALRDRDVL
jgi:hypothetical protein